MTPRDDSARSGGEPGRSPGVRPLHIPGELLRAARQMAQATWHDYLTILWGERREDLQPKSVLSMQLAYHIAHVNFAIPFELGGPQRSAADIAAARVFGRPAPAMAPDVPTLVLATVYSGIYARADERLAELVIRLGRSTDDTARPIRVQVQQGREVGEAKFVADRVRSGMSEEVAKTLVQDLVQGPGRRVAPFGLAVSSGEAQLLAGPSYVQPARLLPGMQGPASPSR